MKELQPHQIRVVKERDELDEKIAKLSDFIMNSDLFQTLQHEEKDRLERQLYIMVAYHNVLEERIGAFE